MYLSSHEFEDLKENYNLESLQFKFDNALEDIEKLTVWIKRIQDQIETVKNTEFKYVVNLHRHVTYNGRVEFYINVLSIPCVKNGEKMYYVTISTEMFAGTKRKQALARAKELAAEYKAELDVQGF